MLNFLHSDVMVYNIQLHLKLMKVNIETNKMSNAEMKIQV